MAEPGSGTAPSFGGAAAGPARQSFKLNMAGLTGASQDVGADLEKDISGSLSKRGLAGTTPSAAASGMFKGIDAI